MSDKEKLELYEKAKKAYYEGNPIMEDFEFDELEASLGLENKSYVGSGSSSNYTVKHPYIMGSLSKVQAKETKSWDDVMSEVTKFIGENDVIITPKYDGCSFEYYFDHGNVTISSRGDGNYGVDLSKHIGNKLLDKIHVVVKEYTLRGEVLIDKNVFATKYSNFSNPRSFVSGILNRKYDDIEDKSVLDDLSLVIYDFRYKKNGQWVDKDWTMLQKLVNNSLLPNFYSTYSNIHSVKLLKYIYDEYDDYRHNKCPYALDGIVIKVTDTNRISNTTRERPTDCVAIKFKPTIAETTVTAIQYQLGKTGEFTPVVYFKPVNLDGKEVKKASGSNIGNLFEKGINIGAKIKVTLSGDIIPYIYAVTSPVPFEIELDDDMYIDGCHLMKTLTLPEKFEIDFMASCKSLGIQGIGDKIAQQIFDSLEYKVNHIFYVQDEQIIKALDSGEGKTAKNVVKALNEARKNKSLHDVIASMNFTDCGPKCALQCAKYIINGKADFSGLSKVGYEWCADDFIVDEIGNSNDKLATLYSVLRNKDDSERGHEFDKYLHDYDEEESDNKIKVILTGSPTEYKTKKEFLVTHPEYTETTKFGECQILFTGDINSTSSKMQKAKKLGIEIRQY